MVDVEWLEASTKGSPALSLYLPIAGGESPQRFLRPLLAELERAEGGDEEARLCAALHDEIEAAEAALSTEPAKTPAVAVFACAAEGVLEVYELPEPVSPMLLFGERLDTWPLREQIARHPAGTVRRRS